MTITDPKTFTKAVAIDFVEQLLPDSDLIEHYRIEAEKGAATRPKPAIAGRLPA